MTKLKKMQKKVKFFIFRREMAFFNEKRKVFNHEEHEEKWCDLSHTTFWWGKPPPNISNLMEFVTLRGI